MRIYRTGPSTWQMLNSASSQSYSHISKNKLPRFAISHYQRKRNQGHGNERKSLGIVFAKKRGKYFSPFFLNEQRFQQQHLKWFNNFIKNFDWFSLCTSWQLKSSIGALTYFNFELEQMLSPNFTLPCLLLFPLLDLY